MKRLDSTYSAFAYFTLYNLIFWGLQLAFMVYKSNSFVLLIPLPSHVYLALVYTLIIHLSLYLLISLLQTTLLWGLVQRRLPLPTLNRWHTIIWVTTAVAILVSNSYFFPMSIFNRVFLLKTPGYQVFAIMMFLLLILGALLLNALFFIIQRYRLSSCVVFFLCLILYGYTTIDRPITKQHSSKANVILIGIDSLSPVSVNEEKMPTLAQFIKNSVLFNETISPLAHTYPSWASILTGLYAQHHQARYNLIPSDMVKSSLSIAWTLQKQGYQTIFATDDRRFNNLGKEFGFQKIIGPKIGVNDTLLGSFNDFPLGNLLINLPISRWIFPYNYGNRASYFSYYPQTFDQELRETLASSKPNTPYFIAVHFTLPHWPYAWAETSPLIVKNEFDPLERLQVYATSIQRADIQVSKLLKTLKQYGYLENSLVILLSDHGEAFYLQGSRQTSAALYQGGSDSPFVDYLSRKTSTLLEMSAGHGTDILSPIQFHCVLAFKIFKDGQLTTIPGIINTRVALIDLAPTIQAFLGLPSISSPGNDEKITAVDGISLLNTILNHEEQLPERHFILESGMLPNQFLSPEKVKLLGHKYFTVPDNGLLQLRRDELADLDSLKLYGLIQDDWLFALYPDDKGYVPVILHLNDGKWTDKLDSDFANTSPASQMLTELRLFYKRDLPLVTISEQTS